FVQNGSDSPQGTLENQGRRGAGHPGMGILVQPSTLAGIDRRHPAGRGRRKVLSSTCSTRCGTCFTLTKQPPRFPGLFTRYGTRAEAEADIFDYIEPFYNRRRKHSTLGYASPQQFLNDWIRRQHEHELAA